MTVCIVYTILYNNTCVCIYTRLYLLIDNGWNFPTGGLEDETRMQAYNNDVKRKIAQLPKFFWYRLCQRFEIIYCKEK